MLAVVECAAHPGALASAGACAVCSKGMCEACAGFEIDGKACCADCAREVEAQARDVGSGMLALVGVGYLLTLAVGFAIWKGRPFIGGLAAVVAIALGRALQLVLKAPAVTRRRTPPRTS